ncbi:MAG: hypothetical protein JOZ07_14740 [Solirubrobacterales bacterium]|nr:hypothetical protein [Solirubrobacterales bacterium]
MIVRIATEGQYEVSDDDLDELNRLDNAAVDACDAGDDAEFRRVFGELVALVRGKGRALADEDLTGSDIILPPPDVSLAQASEAFHGEGLIPG